MIIGIGIDLVRSARIRSLVERWGTRFLHRILSPAERAVLQNIKRPDLWISARFAVKEATLKALGTGMRGGVCWREIETLNDSLGKPVVRLSGKARTLAEDKQVKDVLVSLSHEKEYAVAEVVLLGKENV